MFTSKKSVGLARADCSKDDSTYKVALTVDSPGWSLDPGTCQEGRYRPLRDGVGDTLCLMLDDLVKSRCDTYSESKVTKVVTGTRTSCAPGEVATFYAEPATTVCLGKP
ncbi:hypothetical protein ABZX92_04420 [Lentzea sp. NPDC006480]|uniref:LppU/SCO3897 family protein n=1 Tax=Lentzea sp. NPDC006480 TaxID=3157176 RepID=UPI0033AF90A3